MNVVAKKLMGLPFDENINIKREQVVVQPNQQEKVVDANETAKITNIPLLTSTGEFLQRVIGWYCVYLLILGLIPAG